MTNKSLFRLMLPILLMILLNHVVYSQESPKIEFGEYTAEELKSTTYAPDSTASAVILYERGESGYNKKLEVEYTVHRRIKILKKAGYDWGTVRIQYHRKKYSENISGIEGITAYLDNNGNIIKKELNSDDIFDEELEKYISVKSFSLPALQPGCIIEYRYKVRSDYPRNFPAEWIFQHEEPTVWSEYKTDVPAMYGFAIYEQKPKPFYINENEEFNRWYDVGETDDVRLILNGFTKRLVMKDVPALREEPYLKSIKYYQAKVTYQLASYHPPFSSSQKILQTWEEVAKQLMENEDFGQRLEATSLVEKKVKELTGSLTDDFQKIMAILNFVRNTFIWNKEHNIFASDLDDIFNKKKGDSGDINLLLAAMLKSAGIEIYPVILSTREHGTIYSDYPILDQFNYVIIYVQTSQYAFVLDATDKMCPYYILPKETLNDIGLVIKEDSAQWCNITPSGKDLTIKQASVLINPDGSITGLMRITDEEYSALSARHQLENSKNEEEFLKSILQSDKTGITTESLKIQNKNTVENPLIIESNISSKTYSQNFEKMIYVNPNFLGKMEDNPFKLETRSMPVDYAYAIDKYYKVNIALPNGFTLKEYPKTDSVKIGGSDAGYIRDISINGNNLQFSTRFFVNKITFKPDEYPDLRKFYDKVIAMEGEPLVLQKND